MYIFEYQQSYAEHMTLYRTILTIVFCYIISVCSAQETINSREALLQYQSITAKMEQAFPENHFLTYRRSSFNEEELQTYLTQLFRRMDLLPYIEDQHTLKLHSYLHSANWFTKIDFPKESIKWYRKFFEYYDKNHQYLSEEEKGEFVDYVSYAHSMLAENYAILGNLDSAAVNHKRNIEFTKNRDIINYPSAFNNYGLFYYWHKKELDSALHYFQKAYDITSLEFPEHTLLGSIRDNLADIYIEKQEPEKAVPLYNANFQLYQSVKNEKYNDYDVIRFISAGCQLVETLIQLNRVEQAQKIFKELEEQLQHEAFSKDIRSQSRLQILAAEQHIYESQNNFNEAYQVSQKHMALKDSLYNIGKIADSKWQEELNNITLDRVALNFKINRIEAENKIASQRARLWLVSIASVAILILLTSLFLRRRQHIINARNEKLLAEQKVENTLLKNQQLRSEVKAKKRDLSDFAIQLTQNQDWVKGLADKITLWKAAPNIKKAEVIADIKNYVDNRMLFDKDTQNFYEKLDKLSNAFYTKLSTHFPTLSKTEIRLCSLIRIKMNNRSIATLQNITLASLNTSRYRLRKKLNLSEEEDLNHFIQNL